MVQSCQTTNQSQIEDFIIMLEWDIVVASLKKITLPKITQGTVLSNVICNLNAKQQSENT